VAHRAISHVRSNQVVLGSKAGDCPRFRPTESARTAHHILTESSRGSLAGKVKDFCNAPRGRGGSAAIGAGDLSVRVFVKGWGPHLAIEASGKAWADRARRPCNWPSLTGVPMADGSVPVLVPMLLAACRFGWRHHWNHDRCRDIGDQCRKSDRKFAHALLLSHPSTTLLPFQTFVP
jgi:hypothetical protein